MIWGTEGPEFKSRQPDKQCAGQVVFLECTVWPVVALGVFAVFIVPYGYKGQMGLEEEASPDKWGGSTGATRKLAWRISMHLTGLSRAQQRWVGVPWWNSMVQPVSVRRQIELRFDRAP